MIGYDVVTFRSFDENKDAIYHTNVMMSLGNTFAILCEESIPDEMQRRHVRNSLEKSGKTIINISLQQVRKYCGNTLEMLHGNNIGTFLATSITAYDNFTDEQKEEILRHVDEILPIDVTTIETVGGGSVRCMIGELYA